jgi:hypothetical protein
MIFAWAIGPAIWPARSAPGRAPRHASAPPMPKRPFRDRTRVRIRAWLARHDGPPHTRRMTQPDPPPEPIEHDSHGKVFLSQTDTTASAYADVFMRLITEAMLRLWPWESRAVWGARGRYPGRWLGTLKITLGGAWAEDTVKGWRWGRALPDPAALDRFAEALEERAAGDMRLAAEMREGARLRRLARQARRPGGWAVVKEREGIERAARYRGG